MYTKNCKLLFLFVYVLINGIFMKMENRILFLCINQRGRKYAGEGCVMTIKLSN